MLAMTQQPEQDRRLGLLNSLLSTPHRKIEPLWGLHQKLSVADPLFYMHLAVWYHKHGEVRDHKELFISALCLSQFDGHRDVGLALLWKLPPYQISRLVDLIKGKVIRNKEALDPEWLEAFTPEEIEELSTQRTGLGKNIPRSMRTEIRRYLHNHESKPKRFEHLAVQQRKALKRLYAGLRIQPGELAQKLLFAEEPPPDTLPGKIRMLGRATKTSDKVKILEQHRIPYRIASTLISRYEFGHVAIPLIRSMTPQEVINNLGNLRARKCFQRKNVEELVLKKIQEAQKDRRVSTFKAQKALDQIKMDSMEMERERSITIVEALQEVTEERLLDKGTIQRSTALLIDKSSSMSVAIEVGQRLGSMIAHLCTRGLLVYAFDTMPYPIQPPESDMLEDWRQAFRGLQPNGMTSIGAPIQWMRRQKQRVEQIIIVTDGEENTAPYFVDEFKKYQEELSMYPTVIVVKLRSERELLESRCQRAGIPIDIYKFSGDYYSLPNLIPILTRPSRLDLLMEIMETKLPKRPDPKKPLPPPPALIEEKMRTPTLEFKGTAKLFDSTQGGRHKPIFKGYQAQFKTHDSRVTGQLVWMDEEMGFPDNVPFQCQIQLERPLSLCQEDEITIEEGKQNIGVIKVTEVMGFADTIK